MPGRLVRRGRARDERGQALVEFAIALPPLLIVLFAIIQFGIVFNHWVTLEDAVRAAARTSATCRFSGNGTTAFNSAASDLDVSKVTFDTGKAPQSFQCSLPVGSPLTVTAHYPWSIHIPFIPQLGGNLTSSTTERVE